MKKLLILLVALCSVFQMQATHLMGGEITWECIEVVPDAGKYIFKLKLYRDCDGTSLSTFAQTIYVWDHPTVTSMSLDFISNTDISPDCDVANSGNAQLDCSTNPVGAVEEYLYESQPISLPGSPPTTGWHFTWDSCCRNGAITNLNSTLSNFSFRRNSTEIIIESPITTTTTSLNVTSSKDEEFTASRAFEYLTFKNGIYINTTKVIHSDSAYVMTIIAKCRVSKL